MAEITSPDQLRELVKGRSDEEIAQGVQSQGVDAVLDQVFEGMKDAFDPSRAAGQSAVMQYDVDAPDGVKTYQVVVDDGACAIEKGGQKDPRVTLQINLPNFLRLVSGELNGMQAFMSGQLKVTGDVMFAQTMQNWFNQ